MCSGSATEEGERPELSHQRLCGCPGTVSYSLGSVNCCGFVWIYALWGDGCSIAHIGVVDADGCRETSIMAAGRE